MLVAGVLNEPCTVWFAVVGVKVGMNFLCVLHSVRMVWLRLGDVSGRCAEWAVHSVICCRWCESWNEFSVCSTQCAYGLVKTWWCQWPVCWMSRAQCDLLSLVWELEWIFCVFYNSVRMVWLRFGDGSDRCAEWAVRSVVCCRWCASWNEFSVCFTQSAFGFVKIWWCQWMCWMSRAHCDLLLVVWVLAMAWDSVFLRASSSGVSFG